MKIAITADWHIGAYGSQIDPVSGLNERMMDIRHTCGLMMADMADRSADLVLHLGDMYRTSRPSPTEQELAREVLAAAPDLAILVGNHDGARDVRGTSAPDIFGHFARVMVIDAPFVSQAYPDLQMAFLPYPARAWLLAQEPDIPASQISSEISRRLPLVLQDLAERIDPTRPSLLVGHVSLDLAVAGTERSIMAGRDVCLKMADIPDVFTWRVFGHVHKPQQVDERTWIVGSPERIDFGEEGEQKRWLMLDTDASTVSAGAMESVPTKARRFFSWRLEYDQDGPVGHPVVSKIEVQDAICRIMVSHPEGVTIPEAMLREELLNLGAMNVASVQHDVRRASRARSETIGEAQTVEEALRAYSSAKPAVQEFIEPMVAEAHEIEVEVLG